MEEDEDMNYEYESDGYDAMGDEEEEDTGFIAMENLFYEAEDTQTKDPELAISKFRSVIEMEEKLRGDEYVQLRFQSLLQILKIQTKQGGDAVSENDYEALLRFLGEVSRNDAADAINFVLNSLPLHKSDLRCRYKHILQHLSKLKLHRLWFRTCKRIVSLEMEAESLETASSLLKELYDFNLQNPPPDISAHNTELLQLYALDIELSLAKGNQKRVQDLVGKAKPLRSSIADPKDLAIIAKEHAKILLSSRQWEKAYNEFFEACRNYQEAGSECAKQMLKYAALCNMMAMSGINPLDSQEAKPYQADGALTDMASLWNAFESCDIAAMHQLTRSSPLLRGDALIAVHLEELMKLARTKALRRIIKPYRRIGLDCIAEKLLVERSEVEAMLVKLIVYKEIDGFITEGKYLELTAANEKREDLRAVERFCDSLQQLQSTLSEDWILRRRYAAAS